jgi:hypothetical protein
MNVGHAIGAKAANEQAPFTLTATASDQDDPAQTLTFTLDAASIAAGMSIDGLTGVFNWTPTEAQGGATYPVTVTVTDNGTNPVNLSDAETFDIVVAEVNVAPVLDAIGAKAANEQAPFTFTATASDQDDPAQTLTFTLDAASIAAGMSIDGLTGVFNWTPTEAQGGATYPVTVTVTDNGANPVNLSDAETFDIVVAEVNVAPVLDAIGAKAANEQAPFTLTATASDQDDPAQTLTFTLDAASIAAGMSIDGLTGVFNWTPTEAQGGATYPVTVTVTDNGTNPVNLSDAETFDIVVAEVNVAPVLDAIGAQAANEQAPFTFTATASDQDDPAQTLTFTLDAASIAAGMSIDGLTGVFNWTPTEAQGGATYPVTVTVTDNGTNPVNLSDAETFDIVVAEVNVAPVLDAIGAQAANEQAPFTFTATASDQDDPAQTLTFTLDAASIAAGMSIDGLTGVFNWTPTEAQGGATYPVTVTVTDNGTNPVNLSDAETFDIVVAEVNVAPVLDAIGAKAANEQAPFTLTATASDQDDPAQTLTFTLDAASIAAGMSIDGLTGVFNWTPTEAQGGATYPVTVTVTDNGTNPVNLSDAETFDIVVAEVNVAPVLDAIGAKAANEQAPFTLTATASDQDDPAQTLTFTLDAASIAAGMSIDGLTGVFNWTPTEAQGGATYPVTVTVTDNGTNPVNLSDAETFDIVVAEVNVAPVLDAIGAKAANEQAPFTLTATASDQDDPAQTLTFTLDAASIAAGMSIDGLTGVFNWTPTEAQGGATYPVTVTVTDNGTNPVNLSDAETFDIVVAEVNVAPVLDAIGAKAANEQAPFTLTATASDQDDPAQTLTFTLDAASIAAGMSIDGLTGVFNWTPTEAQGGATYPVTVTVTDNGTNPVNLSDAETFDIVVAEVNVAPVLDAIGNQSTGHLTPLTFISSAYDQDLPAQALTFSLIDPPAGASIDPTSGMFTWTPSGDQCGSFTFIVKVTDDGIPILSDQEEITVTIINTLPVITNISGPVDPESINISISLTITHPDNNLTNAAITWDDASPSVIQNITNPASGSFTVSHTYSSAGVYSVLVTLSDACGEVSATYKYDYVVIYDPNGGFVTGGGWINSPAGAYTANPELTGKANFGFVAKYKKGSTVPEGNTEFQFKAGNINFNSSSYDDMRLVISGFKANYKGVGKINGSGNYGFLVSAIDGAIKNSGGIDKFRIKIWDKVSGIVIYDNDLGKDENDLPTTALGGGSIVIHEGGGKSAEFISNPTVTESTTELTAYPNPTSGPLTIKLILSESSNTTIDIISSTGQVVQRAWNGFVKGGEYKYVELESNLAKGLYFIQMRTMSEIKTVRLVVSNTY